MQHLTTRRKAHAGEGNHGNQIICHRRFRYVDELKSNATRREPILFSSKISSAKHLVPYNERRSSLLLFTPSLTTRPRPVCYRNENVVRISILQVDALAPPLIFRNSSTMKLGIDHSATGGIILGVGALIFLPSVKAAAAQCVGGWDWV